MKRKAMDDLILWKESSHRKPLIVNGARQVGKTWLLKEFGDKCFNNVAYISLDNDEAARDLFRDGYDIDEIIRGISLLTDEKISPDSTLIIIDEIQSEPKALTSLKCFFEQAPEYAVTAAGSFPGIFSDPESGFPADKVNTIDLYPMSFMEFLLANGNDNLASIINSCEINFMKIFSGQFLAELRNYFVVGGMPEVVERFINEASWDDIRALQTSILQDYERDFAKRLSKRMLMRTTDLWESIPSQLLQENKKFVFGRVHKGARSTVYEKSIVWLKQAGLITIVDRVIKPGNPLSAFNDNKAFKLFLLDIGLLGSMIGLDWKVILSGNDRFAILTGMMAEQYVCQQLVSECNLEPFYWSANNSRGKMDFLVQDQGYTWPIEVQYRENLRSKNLRAFRERYEGMTPLRFSLSEYRDDGCVKNIPLWAISNMSLWRFIP
ncbi:MAG: ATP-binding protein [Eggerthellaceae bacterium]|nr:ATP-binding protein [Eggerthellaceae bacterium]